MVLDKWRIRVVTTSVVFHRAKATKVVTTGKAIILRFSSSSCLSRRSSEMFRPPYFFFLRKEVCSEMPILRQTSMTRVPPLRLPQWLREEKFGSEPIVASIACRRSGRTKKVFFACGNRRVK